MIPAYANPYLGSEVWMAVKHMGWCTTEQICIKINLPKACVSKLLSKLVRRGYIVAKKLRGRVLLYQVHPNASCPVDRRPKAAPKIVRPPPPPKPFHLAECWRYFPEGPESKYCARLDTLKGEVRPKYSEAA